MTWIDSRTSFSTDQALTATAVSEDHYDLGSDINVGRGNDLYVHIILKAAADGANADETYSVALQTDDNSGFSSATDLATVNIPRGSAAGFATYLVIPQDTERYLRLNYTLGGTTPSTTVDAFVTPFKPESWESLPDAQN